MHPTLAGSCLCVSAPPLSAPSLTMAVVASRVTWGPTTGSRGAPTRRRGVDSGVLFSGSDAPVGGRVSSRGGHDSGSGSLLSVLRLLCLICSPAGGPSWYQRRGGPGSHAHGPLCGSVGGRHRPRTPLETALPSRLSPCPACLGTRGCSRDLKVTGFSPVLGGGAT